MGTSYSLWPRVEDRVVPRLACPAVPSTPGHVSTAGQASRGTSWVVREKGTFSLSVGCWGQALLRPASAGRRTGKAECPLFPFLFPFPFPFCDCAMAVPAVNGRTDAYPIPAITTATGAQNHRIRRGDILLSLASRRRSGGATAGLPSRAEHPRPREHGWASQPWHILGCAGKGDIQPFRWVLGAGAPSPGERRPADRKSRMSPFPFSYGSSSPKISSHSRTSSAEGGSRLSWCSRPSASAWRVCRDNSW